jgi:phosphoglycolate phosphatase-like HAD superfamily hydrolase
MDRNLILWDFDGVIVNSMQECLFSSYNAFLSLEKSTGSPIGLTDIPTNVREHFFRYRKYVRPAGEYYLMHQSLTENEDISTPEAYQRYVKVKKDQIKSFQPLFFQERNSFRKDNVQSWLDLHQVYPHIFSAWEDLQKDFDFMIVSNKDQRSIEMLLDHFHLGGVGEIYGSDFSNNKREIIQYLLETKQLNRAKVIFIDDHPGHLKDVQPLGVKLGYADWGFGSIPTDMDLDATLLSPENMVEKIQEMAR